MYYRERDLRFFIDNKDKFNKRYQDKYLLIRGSSLVGVFDSYNLAEEVADRMYVKDEYFIQYCQGAGVTRK